MRLPCSLCWLYCGDLLSSFCYYLWSVFVRRLPQIILILFIVWFFVRRLPQFFLLSLMIPSKLCSKIPALFSRTRFLPFPFGIFYKYFDKFLSEADSTVILSFYFPNHFHGHYTSFPSFCNVYNDHSSEHFETFETCILNLVFLTPPILYFVLVPNFTFKTFHRLNREDFPF